MSIIDDKNIKVNNEICQGDGIEEIIPTNIIDNDELPILRDSGGAYEVDTESININELNEDNEKWVDYRILWERGWCWWWRWFLMTQVVKIAFDLPSVYVFNNIEYDDLI